MVGGGVQGMVSAVRVPEWRIHVTVRSREDIQQPASCMFMWVTSLELEFCLTAPQNGRLRTRVVEDAGRYPSGRHDVFSDKFSKIMPRQNLEAAISQAKLTMI